MLAANSGASVLATSYSTAGFPSSNRKSSNVDGDMNSMAMCIYLRNKINRASWMIGWNTRTTNFWSTSAWRRILRKPRHGLHPGVKH